MQTIDGDILRVGVGGIICHQVNCKRVAGAGIALQIREQISGWYGHFKTVPGYLGDVDYYHCGDTVIASLYAQDGFGSLGMYTNYNAMRYALKKVALYAGSHHKNVYIPFKMGCGLGGGDWSTVLALIEEYLPSSTIVRIGE